MVDDRLTRGGPLAMQPARWYFSADITTDTRKALSGAIRDPSARQHGGGHAGDALSLRPAAPAPVLRDAPRQRHGVAVLSLQLYAQPFVFAGDYDGFKELEARKTFSFVTYGRDRGSTIQRTGDEYTVDPDGAGPAAPFTFGDPDFRTRSVRAQTVLRWEYRPGSTLFVVWTHSRSGYFPFDASFDVWRDLGRELFADRATNVLLVKSTYWLNP